MSSHLTKSLKFVAGVAAALALAFGAPVFAESNAEPLIAPKGGFSFEGPSAPSTRRNCSAAIRSIARSARPATR